MNDDGNRNEKKELVVVILIGAIFVLLTSNTCSSKSPTANYERDPFDEYRRVAPD